MLKVLFKALLVIPAFVMAAHLHAADEDLDKLLTSIQADIKAQRLSSPAGNNALERIDRFRQAAPFDYRIVPLTYQWGEAYVVLAEKAMAAKQLTKAQSYLDKVWQVAALTPGLEKSQSQLDGALKNSNQQQVAKKAGPSKAELARQKKLAAAAAKEKARLDAERKRKLAAAKKAEAEKKKRLAAERQRKEQLERERRQIQLAAEKAAAEKQRLTAQLASQAKAKPAALKVAKTVAKPKPVKAKPVVAKTVVAKPVRVVSSGEKASARRLWNEARETTAPLASYPVSNEMLLNRNRAIAKDLQPVCQAVLDNDASVVVHTADKADYRWLTVRLTLCLRRLDKTFRLRHSHQLDGADQPFVTLHPSRGVSLVRQVDN